MRTVLEILMAMKDTCDVIYDHIHGIPIEDLIEDMKTIDACAMRFSTLGNYAKDLDDIGFFAHNRYDWMKYYKFRCRIDHQYGSAGFDPIFIVGTIDEDLNRTYDELCSIIRLLSSD